MSLQKRLTYLLTAFAVFALLASFGTIYGIQWQVDGAIRSFERSLGESQLLERLSLEAREQHILLRDIVDGRRDIDEAYTAKRDAFFEHLSHITRFASAGQAGEQAALLGAKLRHEYAYCLALVRSGQEEKARNELTEQVESKLLPELDNALREARGVLDETRNRSVDEMVTINTRVLALSTAIGVFGAALVAAGTAVVRRWVILPIRFLRRATDEFGRGNLAHRVNLNSPDELGRLGGAMNAMAGSLAEAQQDLQVSEAKYRSLFENLRDAVVICDAQSRVIECHDGDTQLLGDVGAPPGRPLLEAWPQWQSRQLDWPGLIHRVLAQRTQVRAADVRLGRAESGDEPAVVDLIAYPVEFADAEYVAIVLRDVTERQRLEAQARRTEAMEAAVTFARGVAHDFNNLLTSAISTLSLVRSEAKGTTEERLHRSLRACWQAAALSRKLLEFAGGDQGHPQVLSLSETFEVILGSFEETYFDGVQVHRSLDHSVYVRIDPDHLTQIVLNLLRNAREAMPEGGELRISVAAGQAAASDDGVRPATHALLTVSDTGPGMSREVSERLFEPFFTTKTRGTRRSRGMGLAIVYAAVRNAGGQIEVDSRPETGTTFRVCFPLEEQAEAEPELDASGVRPPPVGDTVLLVDDDPMVLQACEDVLTSWGYAVVTAGSIDEARATICDPEAGRIALAIIDRALTGGRGIELARELIASDSNLRLLFYSGLAEEDLPADLTDRVCAQLTKPFRLHELSAAIGAALSPADSS